MLLEVDLMKDDYFLQYMYLNICNRNNMNHCLNIKNYIEVL